ncbi:MAG: IS200/IS605 family transposase [Ruthenibacterium lactatiformans]
MNDNNSLAHTNGDCNTTLCLRRNIGSKLFYGENRKEMGGILRQLSEWKGVKIVEAEVCPDHIHMLVEIPPKMSVAGYIGFLKGKSSLMIFQRHENLKYKYGNRSFWCRGYYVDTAGRIRKRSRNTFKIS